MDLEKIDLYNEYEVIFRNKMSVRFWAKDLNYIGQKVLPADSMFKTICMINMEEVLYINVLNKDYTKEAVKDLMDRWHNTGY